ncbi:PREDICTED: disease resistance protein TAO1-like [Camelina sativa]|uniref:Disease resistance protein TAO1-like n=1 Tax=Camelina sativa TaxID=90675 RepID=A0ABM1QQX1_CAMSA|nr:PREDICTED: disease resistance protein TAO1-like [Camelina sativa]
MSHSSQTVLHLRRLDLTGCRDLKELPDLEKAVRLEELILEGCISLKLIPKSIWCISTLKKLDVSNCDGLNLRLIIRESESFVFQSSSSELCMRVRLIRMHVLDAEPYELRGVSIPNLSISGEIKIRLKHLEGYAEHLCSISEQKLPHELMTLENETPKLMSPPYCFKSLDIMRFNCSGDDQSNDPFKCYSFSDFPWLTELNLINLNIQEIPDDIHHLLVLEKLDLSGNGFKVLPTTMILLTNLKHLTLCTCRRLESLPDLYHQLETLTLSDCTNLQALVNLSDAQQDERKYCLVELWLDNCKNVQSLSDQLTRFENLTYLDISRHEFETVPTSIKDLSSLVTLCLNHCKKLTSLKEVVLPLSLKYLYAHGCTDMFLLPGNEDAESSDIESLINTVTASKAIVVPFGLLNRHRSCL